MSYVKCIACGFLFSFLGITCQPVLAQLNLDSLKLVWKNEALDDTTRLNTLTRIIDHIHTLSYIDSVGYYADIQIRDATAARSEKHLANGLLFKGFYLVTEDQISQGVAYLDSSISINQRLDETYGEAMAISLKGLVLMFSGNVEEGLPMTEEAYHMMEKEGHIRGMLQCGALLSTAYSITGNKKEQFRYARQGMELAVKLGDLGSMAEAYHKMADVYLAVEIYDEGNYYHERALEYSQKAGHKSEEQNILAHMASLEDKQGNYKKALHYLEPVVEWQRENGQKMNITTIEARLIYVLTKAKMYERAEKEIAAFRAGMDEDGLMSKYATAMVNYSEGKMLAERGDHKGAVELCIAAYNGYLGYNRFHQELEACECIYGSYKELGDHQKALEYHEKHQLIQKEINKEQVVKDLQKFEFQKQVIADSLAQVEKERLVQVTHEEEVRKKNKTKNWAIGSGLLFLLLAGGFYSRWRYVRKSRDIISKEKDRSDNLLLNILPAEIAEELKIKGKADARDFDKVSILFTDFKEFTQTSEKLSAQDLVSEINACFEAFDGICGKYKVEKIKTIGDAYMAAGGLPVPTDGSVKNTVLAALEMQDFISKRKAEMDSQSKPAFEMRVGIHTGPVVAGIVGVKKFQYDIWGDTVNTASRMESNGEVGRVNISQATYEILKDDTRFSFENRGKIEAKGKGEMAMYFVRNKS